MKHLLSILLLAAAGARAYPRMFEDDGLGYEGAIEEEAPRPIVHHAYQDRLHYRAETPMDPLPHMAGSPQILDDMVNSPSPPPASLPIARPTGFFDPQNFVNTSAKASNRPPRATSVPLPMPPPGPPIGVQQGRPDPRRPINAAEYQEWLNSIYFGQYNDEPAAYWPNAGLGPKENYAALIPETTGHLPVIPQMTLAKQPTSTITFAVDGSKQDQVGTEASAATVTVESSPMDMEMPAATKAPPLLIRTSPVGVHDAAMPTTA